MADITQYWFKFNNIINTRCWAIFNNNILPSQYFYNAEDAVTIFLKIFRRYKFFQFLNFKLWTFLEFYL